MRNVFLIVLLAASVIVNAQSTEREVISSGGDFYSNSAGQLSITLGETVITTLSNGTNELTQGFQQTKTTIIGIEDYQTDFEMNVFPNPVSEFITIKIGEFKENIALSILTVEGKIILNKTVDNLVTSLNMGGFSKGNYLLNVTENNKIIKTYKIIKQ